MPQAEFERIILALEGLRTCALDRAATGFRKWENT